MGQGGQPGQQQGGQQGTGVAQGYNPNAMQQDYMTATQYGRAGQGSTDPSLYGQMQGQLAQNSGSYGTSYQPPAWAKSGGGAPGASSAPPATYTGIQGYDGNVKVAEPGNEAPQGAPAPAPGAAPPAATTNGPAGYTTPSSTPSNWNGTQFTQTYGGQPGPYGDSGAQILDAQRQLSTGAGRFGSNAASRFGFAPAVWQGDTMPYTARGPEAFAAQRSNGNSTLQQPYFNQQVWQGWRNPATPQGPGNGVSGPPGGAPGAGVDHYSQFSNLMKSGDQLGAKRYADLLQSGNANFLSSQQGAILKDHFGGNQQAMNQWINSNSAGGANWNEKGGNNTAELDQKLFGMMGGQGAKFNVNPAQKVQPVKGTRTPAELAAAAAARAKAKGVVQ